MDDQPFRLDACGDLTPLRRALEGQGYTQPALAELLNPSDAKSPLEVALDLAAAIRRTAAPSPLNTLARLFVLAQAVPEEAARQALAPADVEQLAALGLLRRSGDAVLATTAVLPFAGLLLARDFWPVVTGAPSPPNYVPGVGPATLAVANLTVRRSVQSALDLGTGSGFHALLAAGHAQRVIATDISPRALNIAAVNARLNGVDNVEFRRGNLYEPVQDCQFDLIVSNPPFVISPRSDYCYRDSGLPGDTISEQVIRNAPRFLREGGYSTVLFNWHHQSEADWQDRPKQWVASSGCDAWLLCSDHADPIGYASNWLRDAGLGSTQQYGRLLDEWLAYYDRLGIGKISSGAIILRRRSGGANWIRAERAPPGGAAGACSEQIQRVFAAQDLLEGLSDERELLQKSFVLAADHELQYSMTAGSGRWDVREAVLKQTKGFAFAGEVDRLLSTILVRCDGQRPLGDVVSEVAGDFHVDPEQAARAATGVIRKLLESGFLTVGDEVG
jgi:methylase of polypeptide subunit release factors